MSLLLLLVGARTVVATPTTPGYSTSGVTAPGTTAVVATTPASTAGVTAPGTTAGTR